MTQATFSAGQSVLFNGGIATINSIKGRWINITFKALDGGALTTKNVGFKDVGFKDVTPAPTEDTSGRKNGVVDAKYLSRYNRVKLEDGAIVKDNGDDAAQLLRGVELDEVFKIVAHKLGVTIKSLHEKYDHLNNGQQRMNLGNRLRKALRDADKAATAK